MKCYLAGPINGCTDSQAHDWRNEVTRLLGSENVLNPMARDYRGKEHEAVKDIVENDKRDIDACDILLVWFTQPSVGTSMEILYAWERGKKIIIIDRQAKPLSPWIVYHSHGVVKEISEILKVLPSLAL